MVKFRNNKPKKKHPWKSFNMKAEPSTRTVTERGSANPFTYKKVKPSKII